MSMFVDILLNNFDDPNTLKQVGLCLATARLVQIWMMYPCADTKFLLKIWMVADLEKSIQICLCADTLLI